jgi:hypothetical protein
MSIPTRGETYARLIEHLRLAQEDAATMAHLHNTESRDSPLARGWLTVSEMLKQMQYKVTQFATKSRQ